MFLCMFPLLVAQIDGGAQLLHRLESDSRPFAPTQAVSVGDVDLDGIPDSFTASQDPLAAQSAYHLISGATGEPLWEQLLPPPLVAEVGPLRLYPDLDGDGVDEVLIGAPAHDPSAVHLLSGATGASLWQVAGDADASLGRSLALLDDLNADGWPEVIAGAPNQRVGVLHQAGRVELLSGFDGVRLLVLDGSLAFENFGSAVAGLGDMDGDGLPDLLTSAVPGGNLPELVRVMSSSSGNVLRALSGSIPNEGFGSSLAHVGDADGDGVSDFVVGHPDSRRNGLSHSGGVSLYSGATGMVLAGHQGRASSMMLGGRMISTEDVDQDGVRDLLVSAPFFPQPGLNRTGEVQQLSGATLQPLIELPAEPGSGAFGWDVLTTADLDGDGKADFGVCDPQTGLYLYASRTGSPLAHFETLARSTRLGAACVAAGDLDGDGKDDYAVYRHSDSWTEGRLELRSGADHGRLLSIDTPDADGEFLRLLGDADYDGDGLTDLVFADPRGAPGPAGGSGRIELYSSATGDRIRSLLPAQFTEELGRSLAQLDDLDGDRVPEILAGCLDEVVIFSGGTGAELLRVQASIRPDFGRSVAALDDLDGDGRGDFAVGDPRFLPAGSSNETGVVIAYSSGTGKALYVIEGPSAGTQFGVSLAPVGDLDLDGVGDLVVGAPAAHGGGQFQAGRLHALSGADGGILWTRDGAHVYGKLGAQLVALGDLDGNGVKDFASSNPSATSSAGLSGAGRVEVCSGADGSPLAVFEGQEVNRRLGQAVARCGDLDGDGIGELMLGDPRASSHGIPEAGALEFWTVQAAHPYLAVGVLQAGATTRFELHGVTGAQASFLASLVGGGPTWVPQLQLELALSHPIQRLASVAPQANGLASWDAAVPPSASGTTVWLQAIDHGNGQPEASNALARVIR